MSYNARTVTVRAFGWPNFFQGSEGITLKFCFGSEIDGVVEGETGFRLIAGYGPE